MKQIVGALAAVVVVGLAGFALSVWAVVDQAGFPQVIRTGFEAVDGLWGFPKIGPDVGRFVWLALASAAFGGAVGFATNSQ